ncbi:MAG: zinc metallopeptidase [Xanthomonadales bacterium]|nr:zinc metallopeptidase [Xanthomonadales bacterium]
MHLLIALIAILAVFLGPSWWVKRVMRKYRQPDDRYAGTGGELAHHLLAQLGMDHVGVEITEQGDHYDPQAKMVRLIDDHYHGRSLTAVTVAAHEVGHAVQDYDNYAPLKLRTRLAMAAGGLTRAGSILVVVAPIAALLLRNPGLTWLALGAGVGSILFSAILHLITLPVEWDASFGRALPLLEKGNYLKEQDYPHARKILRAAAMTYVAQALFGLAAAWRWLRLPR